MDAPESLRGIISKAASKHRSDIDAATDCAVKAWRQDDERREWLDEMERSAIRSMICDARHTTNIAIRREAGDFNQPAKVGLSTGAANRVALSILNSYSIGGTCLGDLTGAQLLSLAKSEAERADGHAFNSTICRALAPLVPADKTVRESVNEAKVRKLFKDSQKLPRSKAG